ncbi:MAG TPA: GIY-YIG nuclease family protein, partial [Candidatus Binataceae bacterium]|nr:GIY-YIG nuclease family protein [Candidatus Binataceae bacterium]
MTNRTRRLYIGVTNDLLRRVYEHEHRLVPVFTSKYFLERLVYFEDTDDVGAAVAREKELKGWRRSKKIALIQGVNPQWSDLSRDLIDRVEASPDQSLRGDPSPTLPQLRPASFGMTVKNRSARN